MSRGRIGVSPPPGYDVYFHHWEPPSGLKRKGPRCPPTCRRRPSRSPVVSRPSRPNGSRPPAPNPTNPALEAGPRFPRARQHSGGGAMSLWWTVLSLLAILVLTAGTALFVAAEFSLTALERSTVDANARTGDRRDRFVQRAHRTLSFQLSGAQLGISITTLATGYLAEPVVARFLRPGLDRVGAARRRRRRRRPGRGAVDRDVAVDGLRRTGAQEPGALPAAATARATAGPQLLFSKLFTLADQRDQRHRQLDPAPDGHRTRRGTRLGAHPRRVGVAGAQFGAQGVAGRRTRPTLVDRSLQFGERTAEELMTPRSKIEVLQSDDTVADLIDRGHRDRVLPVPDRRRRPRRDHRHRARQTGLRGAARAAVRDPAGRPWRSRWRWCPRRSTATR